VSGSKLTPLQERILTGLAGLTPRWTLTGGAALAGVYTAHRTTRDLDLFWRGRRDLADSTRETLAALRDNGLTGTILRTSPLFAELRVEDGQDVCIVDLVAEPVPPIEPPQAVAVAGVMIEVDSPHEILVNKLTALLGRSEPRDLWDVKVLLDRGGDLERALRDAPKKDGGFSVLTLAWVLTGWDIRPLGRALGWPEETVHDVAAFREWLVDRLTTLSRPE
jgi:hypothetical protein